ncbi:hypothetical protein B0J14DRAFT_211249 [Halenospora varia]|nr:hypothetical protein B0J14DRAFT_211249 [Halenospora varia]
MDPLSMTASIVGTIGFAITSSKALYDLIDATIEAPKEVIAVSNEAKAFAITLGSLQSLFDDERMATDLLLAALQIPLDNCLEALVTLMTKIKPHVKPSGRATKSKWKGLTWAFKREDTRNLCQRLAHNKLTLATAIMVVNTIKLDSNSKQVDTNFQQLRSDLKARDENQVVLASARGRRGSEVYTDAGFALRRYLEERTVGRRSFDEATNYPHPGEVLPSELDATEGHRDRGEIETPAFHLERDLIQVMGDPEVQKIVTEGIRRHDTVDKMIQQIHALRGTSGAWPILSSLEFRRALNDAQAESFMKFRMDF